MVAVTAPGSTPPDLPRRERLLAILLRDGAECVWCRRPLAPGERDLTLEHVIPRLKGGPAWLDRVRAELIRSRDELNNPAAPEINRMLEDPASNSEFDHYS